MEEGQKVLDAYEKQTGIHADAIWVMNKDQKADGPNEKKQMDYYICYTDGLKDHITWE
jgi:hypothetical protein